MKWKVGSPKVQSKALTINEISWDTEVKETSTLNKGMEEHEGDGGGMSIGEKGELRKKCVCCPKS